MYTFDDAVKPNTGSFYVRQIVGSVNYPTGTDPIDFSHGWLNYQVSTTNTVLRAIFVSLFRLYWILMRFVISFPFLLVCGTFQIEHHVWPDLSMLQYQKGAPKLKAICEKHGVPYIQENVFTRLRKTVDIMVGKATMRVFPTKGYEPASHKMGRRAYWESTNGALDE